MAIGDLQSQIHLACFDGNGNESAFMKADSGVESARYEYDPFGNTLRATGPAARANSLRFSTQLADDVTGRVKYLYRDYDPGIGKWLNRDHIEEAGGLNLYGMVGNAPLNRIDFLGLADTELHHVIPEWLARYSAYGAKGQSFCIRLTTDFHRLRAGFNGEAQLTQIRNQLQSGLINQAQAYNQVLMVHLRDLPAIIHNNGRAGGISGGPGPTAGPFRSRRNQRRRCDCLPGCSSPRLGAGRLLHVWTSRAWRDWNRLG